MSVTIDTRHNLLTIVITVLVRAGGTRFVAVNNVILFAGRAAVGGKAGGGYSKDYAGEEAGDGGSDYAEDYAEDKDFSAAKKGRKNQNRHTVFVYLRKMSPCISTTVQQFLANKIKLTSHAIANPHKTLFMW